MSGHAPPCSPSFFRRRHQVPFYARFTPRPLGCRWQVPGYAQACRRPLPSRPAAASNQRPVTQHATRGPRIEEVLENPKRTSATRCGGNSGWVERPFAPNLGSLRQSQTKAGGRVLATTPGPPGRFSRETRNRPLLRISVRAFIGHDGPFGSRNARVRRARSVVDAPLPRPNPSQRAQRPRLLQTRGAPLRLPAALRPGRTPRNKDPGERGSCGVCLAVEPHLPSARPFWRRPAARSGPNRGGAEQADWVTPECEAAPSRHQPV